MFATPDPPLSVAATSISFAAGQCRCATKWRVGPVSSIWNRRVPSGQVFPAESVALHDSSPPGRLEGKGDLLSLGLVGVQSGVRPGAVI